MPPPAALARKLTPQPGVELPVLRAELEGFDVVYSAPEQLALLTASEPNYDLVEVDGTPAYRSRHGCLSLGGSAVTLAARSVGRTPDEPAILERVRAHLEPQLSLEQFVRASIARGGRSFPPLSSLWRGKGWKRCGRCA